MKKNTAFSLLEISVVIVVVGILIGGISAGYDLALQFKLSSLKSLTLNSPALRINDLYSWHEMIMDESLEKSEVKQGSKITNWYDINKKTVKKINYSQVSIGLYFYRFR